MVSVFLSYVFEDVAYRDQLVSWAQRGELGPGIRLVFEAEDVRQKGDAGIRAHLRPILEGAHALLVMVGTDSHDRRWMDYEIAFAQSARKGVIVVRLPNTTGAAPPGVRSLNETVFSPSAIATSLRSLVASGSR